MLGLRPGPEGQAAFGVRITALWRQTYLISTLVILAGLVPHLWIVFAKARRGDAAPAARGYVWESRGLALLVPGEVAPLRGATRLAEEHLTAAGRTNPRAVGGFLLRGYFACKRGDTASATQLLKATRTTLGPDWQPKGVTSEGDVKQKQHVGKTPLAPLWEAGEARSTPIARS